MLSEQTTFKTLQHEHETTRDNYESLSAMLFLNVIVDCRLICSVKLIEILYNYYHHNYIDQN